MTLSGGEREKKNKNQSIETPPKTAKKNQSFFLIRFFFFCSLSFSCVSKLFRCCAHNGQPYFSDKNMDLDLDGIKYCQSSFNQLNDRPTNNWKSITLSHSHILYVIIIIM